jgi:hypothetical protein
VRSPGAFFLCLWLSLAGHAWAQSELRPHYKPVTPGLDYAHIRTTNQPWSIHIARLHRSRSDLAIVSTLGKSHIQGLSPLPAQAKSVPPALGRALVAVNGDFFLIKPGPYQGDPEGLQILNGEFISTPGLLSFWVEGKALHIEKLLSAMTVTWPDGDKTPLGLNQTPRPDNVVLFTPILGAATRATNSVEIILERVDGQPWLPLQVSHQYSGRVRAINLCGNTPLQPDLVVLTVGSKLTNHLTSLSSGAVVQFSTKLSKDLSQASTAIGGGPFLVHEGKGQKWPERKGGDNYLLPRHPRTALGFNTRSFFLVEVDGRQKELSMGMSFAELAAFMKSLGCTEAMNLDGGGSATFWLDGQVMNSPSDKHLRSLANALAIVRRN